MNDAKRNQLKKRDPKGRIQIIVADKPLGRLAWLAVSAKGNLLYAVTENGLVSIDPAGKVTTLFHEPEPQRHAFFGIWPAADGAVYIADYRENAIKKVAKTGEASVVTRTPKPWGSTGLIYSPDKTLWLLEYSYKNETRVRKIAPNGKTTIF